MKRVLLVCLVLGLFVAVRASVAAAEGSPPNIVVFLADDLGWGDLGCFGNKVIQSPHLDAFAKQGMRLERCYSASAVCSPSRSAILTGRTPHRTGVYTWIQENSEVHLRSSEVTLPKLLRSKGYQTCHVGKWHLNGKFNSRDQPQPDDHGYDWWMATQNNAAPSHKNPTNFVRNRERVGPLEGYSAPLVVGEAVTWLTEKRAKDRPFFLAVWTHEPHLPIESDPKFQEPYASIAEADVRQHHGNVTQLDHAFGTLMKALDAQGVAENTVVVFTSDNGPEGDGTKGRTRGSSGGLRGRKRSMYEGGIRVPGMVRWPGKVAAGSTSATPIIGSDLFPTLLAAAGVAVPIDRVLDGTNVLPIWLGKTEQVTRSEPLFWRLNMAPNNLHMAMRDGDWKIIAAQDFSKIELYDLKADPLEQTDLRTKEPERFARMKAALQAHNAEIEAEGPDWWKRLRADGGGPLGPAAKKKAAR